MILFNYVYNENDEVDLYTINNDDNVKGKDIKIVIIVSVIIAVIFVIIIIVSLYFIIKRCR